MLAAQVELKLTAKFLALDDRNFHCWTYRRFVVHVAGVSAEAGISVTPMPVDKDNYNVANCGYITPLYYWYGMGYMNCTESTGIIPPFNCPGIYKSFGGCGFRTDHAVRFYSSLCRGRHGRYGRLGREVR